MFAPIELCCPNRALNEFIRANQPVTRANNDNCSQLDRYFCSAIEAIPHTRSRVAPLNANALTTGSSELQWPAKGAHRNTRSAPLRLAAP